MSWYATEAAPAPLVATFHTYSRSVVAGSVTANFLGARRLYGKIGARIAVSEAARWTAQRFYGGNYRIIPNGVDLSAARPGPQPGRRSCGSCSWAARTRARGCPCCCAPSRRCATPAWPPG